MLACYLARTLLAESLVVPSKEAGVLDLQDEDQKTAIMIASEKGMTSVVKMLLESGAKSEPAVSPAGSKWKISRQVHSVLKMENFKENSDERTNMERFGKEALRRGGFTEEALRKKREEALRKTRHACDKAMNAALQLKYDEHLFYKAAQERRAAELLDPLADRNDTNFRIKFRLEELERLRAPGLRWQKVEKGTEVKVEKGTEVANEALSLALKATKHEDGCIEFTREEFDEFKLSKLSYDSYITIKNEKEEDEIFEPAEARDIQQGYAIVSCHFGREGDGTDQTPGEWTYLIPCDTVRDGCDGQGIGRQSDSYRERYSILLERLHSTPTRTLHTHASACACVRIRTHGACKPLIAQT